ncbi:hypothetical protein FB451DRAFT_1184429 [Mycena latifolia]|nr:hypothetical protein FB451DRAFT_1184429 [Mycena latifolia]
MQEGLSDVGAPNQEPVEHRSADDEVSSSPAPAQSASHVTGTSNVQGDVRDRQQEVNESHASECVRSPAQMAERCECRMRPRRRAWSGHDTADTAVHKISTYGGKAPSQSASQTSPTYGKEGKFVQTTEEGRERERRNIYNAIKPSVRLSLVQRKDRTSRVFTVRLTRYAAGECLFRDKCGEAVSAEGRVAGSGAIVALQAPAPGIEHFCHSAANLETPESAQEPTQGARAGVATLRAGAGAELLGRAKISSARRGRWREGGGDTKADATKRAAEDSVR